MGWTDTIDVADEQFHPRSDDPYWSENSLLGFNVPERNLSGFIYFYWRPNMNLVVAGPAIWDHTGEDVYNCLYYGWDQHLAIPDGAEMFNFELSNSLSCQMIQPQQEYRFGYDRNDVKFDLNWTAMAEPHYMKLAKTGDEDPGIKNWVKKEGEFSVGHYEQSGWFTGTLEVGGRRYRQLSSESPRTTGRQLIERALRGQQRQPRERIHLVHDRVGFTAPGTLPMISPWD
jgi:hypothetical protein